MFENILQENRYRQISAELFYSDGLFKAVDAEDINFLKYYASKSEVKRSRLCFHRHESELQQEMLIVAHNSSYIAPHMHPSKCETFVVIEGACDALLFDEECNIQKVIHMSSPSGDGAFFYRMPANQYHSCIINSEWLVFLETTVGPFNSESTIASSFAPSKNVAQGGINFLDAARSLYFTQNKREIR